MANPNPVHKFKPGEITNPNGAPKKEFSMTGALRDILSEHNPDTKIERYKELLNKALSMAMKGDGDMLKYLINRIEGMPKGSETQIAVQVNNIVPTHEMKKETIIEYVQKSFTDEDKEQLKEILCQ